MTSQETKTDQSSLIQIIRSPEEPGGTIPLEVWDCTDGLKSSGFDSGVGAISAIVAYSLTPFDM
ncbi:MAG: hypothetical protein GY746_11365, partial [Gammaproteobacteria bacterium]|nr:hypothetical protein [Gammaproteobacteria bacterium]